MSSGRYFLIALFCGMILSSCTAQTKEKDRGYSQAAVDSLRTQAAPRSGVEEFYRQFRDDTLPSQSKGTVGNGALVNGRIVPFSGMNFQYFDTSSYLAGRCFVHEKVLAILLAGYEKMETVSPGRKFYVMECSNREGGKLFPHHTHQNGMSIDFMMPKKKDGKAFYGLDTLGAEHYWLEFDASGRNTQDPSITIDFELIAAHLLQLEEAARARGYKIEKVIIKMELKDELFASPSGTLLQKSGIYITRKLTPAVNEIHDEHYHVDFEKL